jgi:HEAT repeat protein
LVAVRELATLHDPRFIALLVEALCDKSRAVQRVAVEALGSLGDESVVKPLIASLIANSQLVSVQRAIQAALLEIGNAAVEPLIEALSDDNDVARTVVAEVLGELGDARAEDPLIEILSQVSVGVTNPRNNLLRTVASALGNIGDPRAVKPLIDALKQLRDVGIRIAAASALGKIGDPLAVDPLLQALDDAAPDVRTAAMYALGEIGDTRAVQPLAGKLGSEQRENRVSAVSALGQIGDTAAVEPLIQALDDSDSTVRGNAAYALGQIGDTRAIKPLIKALMSEKSETPRQTVEEALQKLAGAKDSPI